MTAVLKLWVGGIVSHRLRLGLKSTGAESRWKAAKTSSAKPLVGLLSTIGDGE